MAARDGTTAEGAIAKLKREELEPGNGEIIWLDLGFIDPRNSKRAPQELMREKNA